ERRGFPTAADSDPVGAAAGSLASTSLRIQRLVVAGRPIRVCLCNRRLAGADAACDERRSRARGLSRRDPADTDGTTLLRCVASRRAVLVLPRRSHSNPVAARDSAAAVAGAEVACCLAYAAIAHRAAAVVGGARRAVLFAQHRQAG